MAYTVKAVFGSESIVKTDTIYQYNSGQVLQIEGLALTNSTEFHLAIHGKDTAYVMTGTIENNTAKITIPEVLMINDFCTCNYRIDVFVYVIDNSSGYTKYKIIIPVKSRPRPEGYYVDLPTVPELKSLKQELNTAVDNFNDAYTEIDQLKSVTASLREDIDDYKDEVLNVSNMYFGIEIVKNKYWAAPNEIISNNTYSYFEKIPVQKNVKYTIFPEARMVAYFREDGTYDSTNRTDHITSITPQFDGFVIITVYNNEQSEYKFYRANLDYYSVPKLEDNKVVTKIGLTDTGILKTNNILTSCNFEHIENSYYDNGKQVSSDLYNYYKGVINGGTKYHVFGFIRFINLYRKNSNGTVTVLERHSEDGITEFTPNETCYVAITYYNRNDGFKPILIADRDFSDLFSIDKVETYELLPKINNHLFADDFFTTNNLLTKFSIAKNCFKRDSNPMTYDNSDSYSVIEGFLKGGVKYKIDGNHRFLNLCKVGGGAVSSGAWLERHGEDKITEFTPTEDCIFSLTVYNTKLQLSYLCEASVDSKDVEEYGKYSIKNVVSASDVLDIVAMQNPLWGKKWYAVGDSFTDYTNASYDPIEYPQMKEDASRKDKTYPFWIGTRNNMEVHNIAISGQTLATPPDGTFRNAFSCESLTTNYKYIPDDADYITIQLGINDSNHKKGSGTTSDGEDATGKIELGTINDTTIGTFYGAWNVILPYLIEHHPFSHIGIIVSIGSGEPYVKATIECAKKWGIAYFNMDGDYQVPLMHRTHTRFDTCNEAKNMRLNAFAINKDGGDTHPNVDAHKYQSTFIEHWMRSL